MTVSFSSRNLFSDQPNWRGLRPEQQSVLENTAEAAFENVDQRLASGEYGFVEELKDAEIISRVQQTLEQLSWAKTLVVVGIGGSDLGARVIQEALGQTNSALEVIFHGDSTDPVQIERLLARIELESTVFNIISKSGETIEIITQYLFFKAKYHTDWQKHFIFTTDAHRGILRQEADQHGVMTLPIPESVGGRFSVLTAVGLLPAAAMGVDISALCQGALFTAQDPQTRQVAKKLALSQKLLLDNDLKLVILMTYSVQLQEFGRWFRQLWAESLGKNGTGILPIKADGPADQHSQLQFYNEGELLQSILFLRVENRAQNYQLPVIEIPALAYLTGHSFGKILDLEYQATAQSLYQHGRPSATVSLSEVSASSLGQLFMLFELAVVYLAELLQVNAFDQPGVEESKQLIYGLLGRTE